MITKLESCNLTLRYVLESFKKLHRIVYILRRARNQRKIFFSYLSIFIYLYILSIYLSTPYLYISMLPFKLSIFLDIHLAIIQLSSSYHLAIIQLSSSYHLAIIQLSSSYHLAIIQLSSSYQSIYLSINSSIHLSIYLSIY